MLGVLWEDFGLLAVKAHRVPMDKAVPVVVAEEEVLEKVRLPVRMVLEQVAAVAAAVAREER